MTRPTLLTKLQSQVLTTATGSRRKSQINIEDAISTCGSRLAFEVSKRWRIAKRIETAPVDVIDMFSGCGGMSAGFLVCNTLFPAYRHVLAVDVDEVANETYRENLGLSPVRADISELAQNPRKIRRLIEESHRCDDNPLVLIGCAPCQGFSSHRNSAGSSDSRNSLFLDFAKIADILRPSAVVVENVPELLTNRYWRFVQEARRVLVRAGYHLHLGVYNMAEFGVAQERFRAVMIGLRHPALPLKGFLKREKFRTVRDLIGALQPVRAGERLASDPLHYSAQHSKSTIATIRAVPLDGGTRPEGIGPKCLVEAKKRQGRGAYDDVYGRLYWDRPAITITGSSRNPASGRFVHPEQHRALTVREAALLQGFPDTYWFAGSLDDRFRQIGNAVPPAFAAYLAVHLLAQLAPAATEDRATDGITVPIGSSFSRLIPALKNGTFSSEAFSDAVV